MHEAKWASGRWEVKDGMVDEFVKRWKDWLGSTSKDIAGFRSARLLRSEDDPLRFTSFSAWGDNASLEAWKSSPGFQEGLASVAGQVWTVREGKLASMQAFLSSEEAIRAAGLTRLLT